MFRFVLAIIVLSAILMVAQLAIIHEAMRHVNYNLRPWQHPVPGARFKVLFAGDSTAVGTGLENNAFSTSGLFSRDFPEVDLENHSYNGIRLSELEGILENLHGRHFDLAVLQIGANDILKFTSVSQIRRDQHRVLDLTKNIASRILILHSGDIGQAPLLIWPFNWIMTWRSLQVRDIYRASEDQRVSYLDIYTLNKTSDLTDCYAPDHLHLNQKGYVLWYSYIKTQLAQRHWLPS